MSEGTTLPTEPQPLPYPNGFYWAHQYSRTLTPAKRSRQCYTYLCSSPTKYFVLQVFPNCFIFSHNFRCLSKIQFSSSLSLSADWGKYFDHQIKPLTPIQASKSIPRTRWANAQPLSRHYHFLQQQHHHHLEGPQVSCESSRHETDFKYLGANKGLSEQNGVSERSELTPFWER